MTSHAHSPGDPVSAAKITVYGTVGVAIIGLITAAVGLLKPGPILRRRRRRTPQRQPERRWMPGSGSVR